MAGEDEDSIAFALGLKIILEALVADELVCAAKGGAGHVAKLRQLPAQAAIHSAEDFFPFREGLGGEGEREILHADLAQAGNGGPGGPADRCSEVPRQAARQEAEGPDQQPDEREFQFMAHWANGRRLVCRW